MTRRRKQTEGMTQQTAAPTWKQGDRCRVFLNGTTYEGLVLSAKGRNTERQCQWVQVQLSQIIAGLDGQPRTQVWVHPYLLPATRLGPPGEQQEPDPQAQTPYLCVTKKIKLQISEQDAATLEFMQGKCRGLYNWWVMKLRDGEKWPGWEEAKKTLQASREYDPELCGVYGKLLQEVYFRLDRAVKAFFRRVKNGEKPGFPRVRPRHSFFTLCYPATLASVFDRIR